MADLNFPMDLLPAFEWGPDVVVLLSAIVSRVTCEQAASLAVATNLSGVNNIIRFCLHFKCKLVYFSTSEIYGPSIKEMSEDLADPMPNNRYGLTKLLGEKLVEYSVLNEGLSAVTLRPFMIYDENEDLGDHRSAMIRFASSLHNGNNICVHNGSERGWLHISDALIAITNAVVNDLQSYEVINIGHPEIHPISYLAQLLCKYLNANPELIQTQDLPAKMTLIKNPSLDKQTRVLGVIPKVSLEEGALLVAQRFLCG